MKKFGATRTLRIERLEHRSLLAAGFIELPSDAFDAVSRFDNGRGDLDPRLTRAVRELSADRRVDPPPTNTVRPIETFTPQRVVVETVPDRILPIATPSQPPTRLVDVALATLVLVDSTNDSSDDEPIAIEQRLETVSPRRAASLPIKANATTFDDGFLRSVTISIPSAATDENDANEGLIDLAPLWSNDSLENQYDASPWRLGQPIVLGMQSIIDRASQPSDEVVDALIQSWFGDSSGMIAIDHVTLPASMVLSPIDWIDVQLESTVMLHRSLQMIASGDVAPISDVALDAIMASLNAMAESQTQPLAVIQPVEVPATIYPAIAVLTAVAIASRRKHRHPSPPAPENH